MTNTIPNVPRELLERASNLAFQTQHYPLHEELRTLLSAPSPDGVDGLEVVGWYRMDDRKAITPYPSVCATWHKMGVKVGAAYSDSAHAIIDGLRGEVAAQEETANQWRELALQFDRHRMTAMARILADRNADACNVNREDNWAIYGQDYIDDVTAMLAAAPAAPAADASHVFYGMDGNHP